VLDKLKKEPWFYATVFLLTVIIIGGFFLYKHLTKPSEVQGTSQAIAETQQGVKITADKAGYSLDNGQAKQVATTIREIRETQKEPVYIVQTTGKEVVKDSEQARKDNKADFSIVTDKNNPDKVVDLKGIESDKKVQLNQYNIQAYKKVIRTIEYSSNKQATFTISRKITDDGQYIGIGAGYDFDNKRVIAKVSYSW
jgi:hypothetical protein